VQGGKSQPVTPATIEAAMHETIHINSQETIQADFTHATNEGVTEYFAEIAMGTSGSAYRDQLELAKGLKDALGPGGEQKVADAFFKGDRSLYQKIVEPALSANGSYSKWRKACNAEPPDYRTANDLLMAALATYRATGNPVPPPVKQPSAAAGSGSASGSGSGSAAPNAKPPTATRISMRDRGHPYPTWSQQANGDKGRSRNNESAGAAGVLACAACFSLCSP
jgi:hypothetical protein